MTRALEALSRSAIDTLDPTGKGVLPLCPHCFGTLRHDLDQGWWCDMPRHEHIPVDQVIWHRYREDKETS